MPIRPLLIFLALILITAGIVIEAVTAYRRPPHEPAPAVQVDSNKATGNTTVDAPSAHVEQNKDGTKVEAPGVKIEVPKSPSP